MFLIKKKQEKKTEIQNLSYLSSAECWLVGLFLKNTDSDAMWDFTCKKKNILPQQLTMFPCKKPLDDVNICHNSRETLRTPVTAYRWQQLKTPINTAKCFVYSPLLKALWHYTKLH